VYLIDTNVVSETRKKERANPGVARFFDRVTSSDEPVYLSVISLGELRRGVELIRHRGDSDQAKRLETWLTVVFDQYGENILPFEAEAAQVWGRLRVPNPGNELDKQIAAGRTGVWDQVWDHLRRSPDIGPGPARGRRSRRQPPFWPLFCPWEPSFCPWDR
jgi:predicted nucleic acid-binding protein